MSKIFIPKETLVNETRVSATPETVKKLIKLGFDVFVEAGAGKFSGFQDSDYIASGGNIKTLWEADILLKVRKPNDRELAKVRDGAILFSLVRPVQFPSDAFIKTAAQKKLTVFAMELIPRIARAQKLDALSSQAGIAGYKAVILAANASGKLFPMMMTAAGTIQPARVLVIGAGVAGLQAVATAKRLGAIVEAFDTRAAAKDQVESLGGKFLELAVTEKSEDERGYATEVSKETHEKELELISSRAKLADVVITTALIPGKKAPVLVTEKTVAEMKPGAIIVDLAAERGGNCPLAKPDEVITTQNDVKIFGLTNLPATMAFEASQLYARNVLNLLNECYKGGQFDFDLKNEVIENSLLLHQGEIVSPVAKTAREKGIEV